MKRKLLRYARLCEVDVVFVRNGQNIFLEKLRRIEIELGQTPEFKISSILHELGHFIAYQKDPRRHYSGRAARSAARKVAENAPMSRKQKDALWGYELAAWKEARCLAKQLKISLGRWFKEDETNSLNSYRSHPVK